MKLFVESLHCKSRMHCKACRDPIGGAWLASMSKMFAMPTECPRGHPMGFAPLCGTCGGAHETEVCPIDPSVTPVVAERIVRTGGCCGKPTASTASE
jgi:hypothetical protein